LENSDSVVTSWSTTLQNLTYFYGRCAGSVGVAFLSPW